MRDKDPQKIHVPPGRRGGARRALGAEIRLSMVVVAVAAVLGLGVSSAVFIFKECGVRGFLFGNGALYAAATGACKN